MRIVQHPILDFPKKKELHFLFDGHPLSGIEGDTIASALHAAGIRKLSESIELHRPRGFYCAIGNCSSCHMTVNGIANIKTCVTLLREGMIVEMQTGKGVLQ
jgi:aerobic-type carbon monoxide dehydrogenase small subunit (CoxS/CutS family)